MICIDAIIFRFARDRTEFSITKLSQIMQHNVTEPSVPLPLLELDLGQVDLHNLSLKAVFFPMILYPLAPFEFLWHISQLS